MGKGAFKPKELVSWEPRREGLIARYIDALMDILFVDSDGRVKTSEHFKLDAYLEILSQNVELYNVPAVETKRGLINKAAFLRLKKYKSQNIHTFRRALAAEVRSHLLRPAQKYWILYPLHVAHGQFDMFRSFSILGTKLLVRDWKYVRKRFMLDAFLGEIRFRITELTISLERDFTPMMVLTEGQDVREAFEKAVNALDLFRWLLNLLPQFGVTTHRWGGYAEPLGKILPSPVYAVFKLDGEYEAFFYDLIRYSSYGQNTLPPDQILDARRLANRLRIPKSEDDTVLLIVEALEKYGQALDTTEWRLAFLLLWQILELLTLQSPEEFSMKTVENRVNVLLQQDQLTRDLLSTLRETRNTLVHRGYFPDEQGLRQVNLLKHITEHSINAVFDQLKSLPTRSSLAKFYEHAPAANSDLADRQRVIAHIRRQRAKTKTP